MLKWSIEKDAVFILKRELTWIPLFGQYVNKMRMIPVNRAARGKAMTQVLERTKREMERAASSSSIRKAPAARLAPSLSTVTASRGFIAICRCRSSHASCIRACSGRAASSCASRATSRSASWSRSSRA